MIRLRRKSGGRDLLRPSEKRRSPGYRARWRKSLHPLLDPAGKASKPADMSTSTISTKGQLVIPQRIRKALHLRAGEKVTFTIEGEKLVLQREQPKRARLIEKDGRKVLEAPPGAPPMTPETIKALLADFP